MWKLGKLLSLISVLLGSIFGIYVFLWEDLGDSRIAGRHHLVANSNYLHAPATHFEEPDVSLARSATRPVTSHSRRSEVKVGDRLPQGVDNEGEEERASLVVDGEARAQWRARQYCGPPEDNVQGDEGVAPPGYNLEHVHVVLRHGDRSPMYALPGYEAPWIPCEVNISMARSDRLVKSYLRTMRMQWRDIRPDSTSFRFGLYPHSRYCEGAQMTGLGAVQHIKNGQLLGDAYIRKWKLLSPETLPEAVQVISTEYTRTYQSAVAFLFGFLPLFDISQIPISLTRTVTFCSHQLTGFSCECMMAYRLEAIIKKEYSKRARNSTLHARIKRKIAQILKVPEAKLPWLSALSDVFNGHVCHGMKLPCAQTDPDSCITWDLVGKVWQYLDYNGLSQLGSYAYQRQQRLLMHPLLHIILHRMHNVTAGVERSRVVVYSGHDKTVTPLATTLGIHDGRWPRYASRLVFELFSKDDAKSTQQTYYLRVIFNGEDRTRQVRFCKGKTIDNMCPLSYFQNFVFYEDLQYFGKTSYREACHA